VILFFLTHAIPIVLPACFGRGYSSFSVKDPLVLQKADNLPVVEDARITAPKTAVSMEPSTNQQADQMLVLQREIDTLRKNDQKLWISFLVFAAIMMTFFIILLRLLSKNEFSGPSQGQSEQRSLDNKKLSGELADLAFYIDKKIKELESKFESINKQSSIKSQITPKNNSSNEPIYLVNNTSNDKPLNLEDYITKLIQQYNDAIQSEQQKDFENIYKPVRLGISPETVMSLGRGEAVELFFQNRPDGDYWAIDSSKFSSRPNTYWIIPRFIPFDDILYQAGAMGRVFNCINFNPRYRYENVELIKPAMFTRNGNTWRMIDAGSLQFRQGKRIN
jgi:hypothetical protein